MAMTGFGIKIIYCSIPLLRRNSLILPNHWWFRFGHYRLCSFRLGDTKLDTFLIKIEQVLVFCYRNCTDLLLKFDAESRKVLKSLEQFIPTVKGQTNFLKQNSF